MDDIPSVHDTNVWLHNEAQIWTKASTDGDWTKMFSFTSSTKTAGQGKSFSPLVRESAAKQWLYAKANLKLIRLDMPDGRLFFAIR